MENKIEENTHIVISMIIGHLEKMNECTEVDVNFSMRFREVMACIDIIRRHNKFKFPKFYESLGNKEVEIKDIHKEINDTFSNLEKTVFEHMDFSKYKNKKNAYYHGARYMLLLINGILDNEGKNE